MAKKMRSRKMHRSTKRSKRTNRSKKKSKKKSKREFKKKLSIKKINKKILIGGTLHISQRTDISLSDIINGQLKNDLESGKGKIVYKDLYFEYKVDVENKKITINYFAAVEREGGMIGFIHPSIEEYLEGIVVYTSEKGEGKIFLANIVQCFNSRYGNKLNDMVWIPYHPSVWWFKEGSPCAGLQKGKDECNIEHLNFLEWSKKIVQEDLLPTL